MTNPVDNYISTFPKDIQAILTTLRSTILEVAPNAEESIGYGMPAYKYKGKPLAYFAAFKAHIGFYPTPSPIEDFKDELSQFHTSKGAVQFPLNKPMPINLIKKMVKARMKTIDGQ